MEKSKGLAIMVFGKGSKHRTTYIFDNHVVNYISRWLKSKANKTTGYLFMTKFWKKYPWKTIEEEGYKAQRLGHYVGTVIKRRTGFPSHSLRRAFATHLCKIGWEDSTIQSWLGHNSFNTTKRYIDDEVLLSKVSQDIRNRLEGPKQGSRVRFRKKVVTTVATHEFLTYKN